MAVPIFKLRHFISWSFGLSVCLRVLKYPCTTYYILTMSVWFGYLIQTGSITEVGMFQAIIILQKD